MATGHMMQLLDRIRQIEAAYPDCGTRTESASVFLKKQFRGVCVTVCVVSSRVSHDESYVTHPHTLSSINNKLVP